MRLLLGLLCAIALGWQVLLPALARADQGVAIDLGSIAIDERLSPGGRYRLPTMSVRNVGDEAGEYEVVISYLQDEPGSRAPAKWFSMDPQRFHLEPSESRPVSLHITLPTGAEPGDYNALIEAHPVREGEGVQVTAAAASRLTFTVKPSNAFSAWLLQIRRGIADYSPWSYLGFGLVLVAVAGFVARRNLRLGVRIERRR